MATAVLALLVGASVGSFVNVVADRLPRGLSLLRPPSHCPACGRLLTPLELVPVLSYLALRGRCYRCHAPIPIRVLAVELALGLLALFIWQTYEAAPASLVLFAYAATLLLVAVIDVDHGIIPDAIIYPAVAIALVLSPWWRLLGLERGFLGQTDPAYIFLGSLAGAVTAAGLFAIIILLYPRGMGWGDVKLAALLGLVSGIPGALVGLLVAILSGGAVAAFLLVLRRRRHQTMPFGPFLALGALTTALWGAPLWRWYLGLL